MLVRGVEDGQPRRGGRDRSRATCWWRRAASRSTTSTPSTSLLRDAGLPLELTLVRGAEERTVTVNPPSEAPSGDEGTLVN